MLNEKLEKCFGVKVSSEVEVKKALIDLIDRIDSMNQEQLTCLLDILDSLYGDKASTIVGYLSNNAPLALYTLLMGIPYLAKQNPKYVGVIIMSLCSLLDNEDIRLPAPLIAKLYLACRI